MKIRNTALALVLGLNVANGVASDLLTVYEDALLYDPTFKQAESQWLSSRLAFPIAKTLLLPALGLTGAIGQSNVQSDIVGVPNGTNQSGLFSFNFNQPIINMSNWSYIRQAKDSVKAAAAVYAASAQSLIQRTLAAYFNVLRANAQLQADVSQKNAYQQQLTTTQQQYKVGLVPLTNVLDAEASFNAAVAAEITDRNNLLVQLENLRAITGRLYPSLMGPNGNNVPLRTPDPLNPNCWVGMAERQNLMLKAQLYTVQQFRQAVQTTDLQQLPTFALGANYQKNQAMAPVGGNTSTAAVTLNLNFPILGTSGGYGAGYMTLQGEKAHYDYLTQVAGLDVRHSQVVTQTRQDYLGVMGGISKIHADQQSILSNQKALAATKAGYEVGIRPIGDVLVGINAVNRAQSQFANDFYNYLLSFVGLKQDTGTLNIQDVRLLNALFTREVNFVNESTQNDFSNHLPNYSADFSDNNAGAAMFNREMRAGPAVVNMNNPPQLTIQLFVTPRLAEAEKFVKKNQTTKHPLTVSEMHGWYIVTTGQYSNHHAANRALKVLPQHLLKYKPWVKSLRQASSAVTPVLPVASQTTLSSSSLTAAPATTQTALSPVSPVPPTAPGTPAPLPGSAVPPGTPATATSGFASTMPTAGNSP